MQITLSTTNWLARYYYWVRGVYPTTLCPYFWSMIIFIICSPFIAAVKGVIYIIDNIPVAEEKPRKVYTPEELVKRRRRSERMDRILEIAGKITLGIMLLTALVAVVFIIIELISKVGFIQVIIGFLAMIGAIAVLWGVVEAEIFERLARSMFVQVPSQAISGAYHKMCPRIIWTSPETKASEKLYAPRVEVPVTE